MRTREISNSDDIIDSRDVIQRISDLDGTDDEDEQLNALIRIIDLREQDLALLRQATAERIRAAGLGASTFDRSESFREQRDAVESSLLGVKGVGKTINASGDSDIIRQFRVLNEQIDSAKLKLSQGLRAENLIDVTDARERIQRIADEIDALRIKAEAKIVVDLQIKSDQAALKEQFDQAAAYAKDEIARASIKNKLESSLLRGLPSAELRREIAGVNAQLEESIYNVNLLSRGFDGTKDSVERLNQATDRFKEVNVNLSEVRNRASESSQSMNTLTNNAYQLGQAFEDFSVGFSLNGIAGGIRGAANNVAFLLNDLSRMPQLQNAIGEKFARMLPLVAGIGSAVAITVIPALVEWLESLNDIETKFEDISDIISQDLANVKFDVGLESNEREFLRTIQQAKELKEVLEALGEVRQKSADQAEDLQKTFQGLDKSESLPKALEQIAEFERILNAEVDRKSTVTVLIPGGGSRQRPLIEGESPEFDKLKKQLEEIRSLNENLRKSVADGYFGDSDVEQLKKTEDAFRKVKESASTVLREADLADEKAAEKFDASLGALQETIDEVSKSRQEIESLNRQITEGFTSSQTKFDEFLEKQTLIREVIAGTKNEQELFVFESRKAVKAYDDLIEKVRAAKVEIAKGKDGVADNPFERDLIRLANVEARRAREALRMEAETVLLQKKKDLEDEIEKVQDRRDKKRSISTTLDKYPEILQRNVLSSGSEDDNTEQLKRLTDELKTIEDAIRELNATMSAGNSGIFERINQFLDMAKIGTEFSSSPYAKAAGTAIDLFQGFFNASKPADFKDGISDVLGSKETFADAIRMGVEQGMEKAIQFITNAQGQTTEAVEKIKAGAVAR